MKSFGLLPRVLVAIAVGIAIGSISPEWMIRGLATFNGLFGNFLGFVIPLIIIGFIAPGIGQLGKGAEKMLGMTAGIAYGSTVTAGLLAFTAATILFPHMLEEGSFARTMENPEEVLAQAYFTVDMPPVMGVMTALLLAFTIGLGMAAIKGDTLQNTMNEFRDIIEKLIASVIIPLLPIHILGIFANMTYGGAAAEILSVFIKVFAVVIALHVLMIILQYTVTGTASGKNPFKMLRNMLPAYFTALGTQSSAATIPVTLRQAKKNNFSEKVVDFVVPLSATIHLSGSTITLVSTAMAVMMLNGMEASFTTMLPFILMLGVTMIAAPGVPGGAVMAALGIMESMLAFDSTLLALMIALYLAQDSFGTACNVTGDGAIAGLVDKIQSARSGEQIEENAVKAG
ncbi:dicarboxylate/amino acid:cation symporter [Bacillus marinisedimentorum]|uniref:dicarboxylate/amino acid:cation symporter n=1 Tax=Bacillus marinisedimentorum TaxID=1821260 RepID=UPI0007E120D2|nr:dicarboxylate/amino acid:cation symporter [Bacillus marinisedimentorum]